MAQFPANIDLSNLDGNNGFQLSGVAELDFSGVSVTAAGDVNGDGFADVIVGAFGADPHGTDSGASYVVFGRATGFAANIDLSSLDGSNGFKLSGVTADDFSGSAVASAGDVNGDGFADLIIGAPTADPHGIDSGASYVVFGHAGGFAANFDLSDLDGSNGFKLSGVAADDISGSSVASAGDVNGDGFADLIVGSYLASSNGNYSGASYVLFGRAIGFAANINLSSLDGSNGFQLSGAAEFDLSGYSVASAGDVNGDGFADLIVGAIFADPHGAESGASYVVFGRAGGLSANIALSSLDGSNGFRLSGVAEGDNSGFAVASAGDVNGDGFADLIIGAPFADPHGIDSGASYVVFGHAAGFSASIDLSSLDGGNGFQLSGVAEGDNSGASVASAGDVNGDGFDDVIVGAYLADPLGADTGVSYVVFGHDGGFSANLDLSSLDGSNGFQVNGIGAFDLSGHSVASAGDVNRDGFADLIVGAEGAGPNGNGSGAGYVVFGRAPDTAVNRNGTVAAQTLAGGSFNDTLSGFGGDDRLFGNGGSDNLIGGLGADIFFYRDGDGADVVSDFSNSQGDIIDLAGVTGIHTFADILSRATQNGADTFIDFGGGDSLTLTNVNKGDLTAADFVGALVAFSIFAASDFKSTNVNAGHLVTITMMTNEPVSVVGTPTLQLNGNEVANFTGGSGTNTLSFTYVILPSDNIADLRVTGLNLPARAAITDSHGNSLSGPVTGDLGLTINGRLSPADVVEEINGLYVGLYAVAATQPGIEFWINVAHSIDASISLANASNTAVSAVVAAYLGQQFVQTQSTYFNSLYAALNDTQFVTALYQNLTNSGGSAGGVDFWFNQLLAAENSNGHNVQDARAAIAAQFVHDVISIDLTVGAAAFDLTEPEYAALVVGQQAMLNKTTMSGYFASQTVAPGGNLINYTVINSPAFAKAHEVVTEVTNNTASVIGMITGINNAIAHQDLSFI